MSGGTCAAASFRHEALFYDGGLEGFVREIAPMVSQALQAGGSAVVAAPTNRVDRLRALFGDGGRLELIDMTELGVNPARIIPAWRELADGALVDGTPFLGVGEPIWVGRTEDELDECHRHEALINVAFADDPAWRLVCPYDRENLPAAVIADARRTHPTVVDAEFGSVQAPVDGLAAFRSLERPLSPVPEHAQTMPFACEHLADIREAVMRHAVSAGLSRQRSADLLLAVTEMATNSIRHGGGGGTLTIWHRPGAVTCQTVDAGRISDPMVGRRRPGLDHAFGRGMWIIHQLCDLVQIRSLDDGTAVRALIAEG